MAERLEGALASGLASLDASKADSDAGHEASDGDVAQLLDGVASSVQEVRSQQDDLRKLFDNEVRTSGGPMPCFLIHCLVLRIIEL